MNIKSAGGGKEQKLIQKVAAKKVFLLHKFLQEEGENFLYVQCILCAKRYKKST